MRQALLAAIAAGLALALALDAAAADPEASAALPAETTLDANIAALQRTADETTYSSFVLLMQTRRLELERPRATEGEDPAAAQQRQLELARWTQEVEQTREQLQARQVAVEALKREVDGLRKRDLSDEQVQHLVRFSSGLEGVAQALERGIRTLNRAHRQGVNAMVTTPSE